MEYAEVAEEYRAEHRALLVRHNPALEQILPPQFDYYGGVAEQEEEAAAGGGFDADYA